MPLEPIDQSISSANKDSLRRRVQRPPSPNRLFRKEIILLGGITISAEKHRGRVMVRVEVPAGDALSGLQSKRLVQR